MNAPASQDASLTRGLGQIADQINERHKAVNASLKASVEGAIEAGELLQKAKERLPHGQWLTWITANLTLTPRTVQTYMRIARNWPRIGDKYETVSHLTLRQVIDQIADPPEEAPSGSQGDAIRPSPSPASKSSPPTPAPPTHEVQKPERRNAPRAEFVATDPALPFEEQITDAQRLLLENLGEQIGEHLAQPGQATEAAEVVAILRHLIDQVHSGELDAAWFLKRHSIEGAAA